MRMRLSEYLSLHEKAQFLIKLGFFLFFFREKRATGIPAMYPARELTSPL